MNEAILGHKIKTCVVGTGDWGNKVYNAASIISRYELIGTINSSTPLPEKDHLLNEADLIYIATPPESQKEYVDYAIRNNKHCICETPFLMSLEDRVEVYNLLKSQNYKKIFHINFPFFLDADFAKIASKSIRLKSAGIKFVSIKCSGNKYLEDLDRAKRMYACQAINLIVSICGFLNISKFDKFIIHNDTTGEFQVNETTFIFSWGQSDIPKLEYSVKTSETSETETIIYDNYDQIVPLLLMFSNRVRNELPSVLDDKNIPYINMEEFNHKLAMNAFMLESTAEDFTDRFMQYNGTKFEETDSTKLFFNGGLINLDNKLIQEILKRQTSNSNQL